MRVVFKFGKLGRLKYVSHLDLQRFMQRALRRTELPVAYSQGFNPHAQLAFASALAMGWTSECEMMDIKLTASVSEDEALAQIRSALPPEMPVYGAYLIDDRAPALMAALYCADYQIWTREPMWEAVQQFMASETFMATRKTKSGESLCDIRPMALDVKCDGEKLLARLTLTEKATLKPDLLASALGGEALRVHRLELFARAENGGTTPLIDYVGDR